MVIWCSLIMFFIFIMGCQELLDDALTEEVPISQSLVKNVQVRSVIPVIVNPKVLKPSSMKGPSTLMKTMTDTSIELSPDNPELFTELILKDAMRLIGDGDPNGSTGDFGIYFDPSDGLSDPKSSATVITEFNLTGLSTIDINEGPSMKPFFQSNPDIATFYLYLDHSNGTAEITINSLKFVLDKPILIEKVIYQDTSVSYSEVEGILNVKIAGSVTNNGVSVVDFTISVEANNGSYVGDWEGVILTSEIAPGATLTFGDLETDPTFQQANLEDALAYLSEVSDPSIGGDLKATVGLNSVSDIIVDIASLDVTGTAQVKL